MPEINTIILNGVEYTIGGSGGTGLTEDMKQAFLAEFRNVSHLSGTDTYGALQSALYPPQNLSRISCVYTPSGTVYASASLDTLKPDLVVTAHYDDSSTETVTNYILSGTLVEGTNTITVSYGGKTTTFTVVATTSSPQLEYLDCQITSGGKISSVNTKKAVTVAYELDTVSAIARNIKYAIFFPREYTDWQQDNMGVYLDGQTGEAGNGEQVACRSTYGLSNGSPMPIAEQSVTLKANAKTVRFTLPYWGASADDSYTQNAKEYCYAYIQQSGYVIYAGSETPYYNKRYITD